MSNNIGPFHQIADAYAILRSTNGVYRQAKIFRRGQDLFAGHGGGFIRLYATGTSVPTISVDTIELPRGFHCAPDTLGRLSLR